MFIAIAIAVLLGAFLIYSLNYKQPIDAVHARDHYTFEGLKFSTQEFYALSETFVNDKEIPGVVLSRVEHKMGGLLSAKREYLRVTYKEYFFDICAAPFAKDFFVSWRQGELQTSQKRVNKTFYEEDTERMFKSAIKLCVDRAVEQMSAEKGIRMTREHEMPLLN